MNGILISMIYFNFFFNMTIGSFLGWRRESYKVLHEITKLALSLSFCFLFSSLLPFDSILSVKSHQLFKVSSNEIGGYIHVKGNEHCVGR